MPGTSISEWITEQEVKRKPSVFLLEWVFIFALAGFFWTAAFSMWQRSYPSAVAVVMVSALYAFALVYLRLFNVTCCTKCRSLLPLLREEIGRSRVREREQCVEVEYGSDVWERHTIALYNRIYRMDRVNFRCRRCHGTWEEMEELPASRYKLVRTIDLSR